MKAHFSSNDESTRKVVRDGLTFLHMNDFKILVKGLQLCTFDPCIPFKRFLHRIPDSLQSLFIQYSFKDRMINDLKETILFS